MTGVSRTPRITAATSCRALPDRGYEVFAVNPNAEEVEGDAVLWRPDVGSGGVDWVVIGTRPETADDTGHQCAELAIDRVDAPRVWDPGAVTGGRGVRSAAGMTVIAGGRPRRLDPTADPAHKVMRVMCTLTGAVPRHVEGD